MMTRRKFIALGALALPTALGVDAAVIEPNALRIAKLNLGTESGACFVQFTDFHFKGDTRFAAHVVSRINELAPDFACFTGDLVEDKRFAAEALDFITRIQTPVYGVPGNHDYWCGADFADYQKAFAATGGEWLVDRSVLVEKFGLESVGMAVNGIHAFQPPLAARRLLLMHYPGPADTLEIPFDLILAGHSHGGQVRLPFYGAPILPWGVGRYDLGYFDSKFGPLYVNPGIGTYRLPVRFNCRPELTVVTM
jgi:hypothetical protein